MPDRTLPPWTDDISDGCSFAPDSGWWGSHREACANHDRRYYFGGSREWRASVDYIFRADLVYLGMPAPIAWIYYRAVRIYGHPRLRRPYSWAFGDRRFRYDDEPAVEETDFEKHPAVEKFLGMVAAIGVGLPPELADGFFDDDEPGQSTAIDRTKDDETR